MWANLWMKIFGATQWLGLDIGFWVSMGVVALIVVIMHVVFWGIMKPKKKGHDAPNHERKEEEITLKKAA